jgi:hypothetical protein
MYPPHVLLPSSSLMATGPASSSSSISKSSEDTVIPTGMQLLQLRLRAFKTFMATREEPSQKLIANKPRVRAHTAELMAKISQLEPVVRAAGPNANRRMFNELETAIIHLYATYWLAFRINDLPSEILTHIFRFVCWSAAPSPTSFFEEVTPRLVLTRVCRHWRRVMIDDGSLWACLWIRKPRPGLARLPTWLDRSQSTPLDIRINWHFPDWDGKEETRHFSVAHMQQILDRLVPRISKIRSFIISADDWRPLMLLLKRLADEARTGVDLILDRLDIHRIGRTHTWLAPGVVDELNRQIEPLLGARDIPLTQLCLNGVYTNWRGIALSKLRVLDLRHMPLTTCPTSIQFRDMLAASPLLEKLVLDGAGPRWSDANSTSSTTAPPPSFLPRAVELPNLKSLAIGDFALSYSRWIITHLRAPNVRQLTLMNLDGEDFAPLLADLSNPIYAFRAVRSLTIYAFEFDVCPWSHAIISRWLNTMPELRYLRLARVSTTFLSCFFKDEGLLAQRKAKVVSAVNAARASRGEPPFSFPSAPPPSADATSAASTTINTRMISAEINRLRAAGAYLSLPTRHPIDGVSYPLCKHLHALEFMFLDPPESVIDFLRRRREEENLPLEAVYINRQFVKNLSPLQVRHFKEQVPVLGVAPGVLGGYTEHEKLAIES